MSLKVTLDASEAHDISLNLATAIELLTHLDKHEVDDEMKFALRDAINRLESTRELMFSKLVAK